MGVYRSLHTHTEFSFLDGLSTTDMVAQRAVDLGMDSIAITDHGECSGHVSFEKSCQKLQVKPLFGMEGYLVDSIDRVRAEKDSKNSHIILLAENNQGLKNLWTISSLAYMKGFYYKPLADWEMFQAHSKGLIATSACMLSYMARHIINDDLDSCRHLASQYLRTFGEENFFLELHTWQLLGDSLSDEHQKLNTDMSKINQGLVQLSNELGIPTIVVNDAHYCEPHQAENHGLVWSMSTNSDQAENKTAAAHIMDDEEVVHWMGKHGISRSVTEEAIKNTAWIAERCNAEIERKLHIPILTESKRHDLELFATHIERGFQEKVVEKGLDVEVYQARMLEEAELITKKDFFGYFNIVADYCLSPETPVLTSDLRWVPIGSLEVGQRVAGFDEENTKTSPERLKSFRYWKDAEVLDVRRVELPCYEVLLEDGTRTIASEDHKWLVYKGERARPADWVRTKDLVNYGRDNRYGETVELPVRAFKILNMWETENTWEEGYIGGLLDGEASLHRQKYAPGEGTYEFSLTFSQNEGVVLDTFFSILQKWGFSYTPRFVENFCEVAITGPRVNALSLLGRTRPYRLLEKVDLNKFGRVKAIERPRVVSVKYLGIREVVAVETSSSTMIAQGFAHHNCKWAKTEDSEIGKEPWLVGPSRGSAGGSLVAYLMDITELDPVKYDLLFGRFIDPGRVSFPDIDLDFPQSQRNQMKNYLAKRYGEDKVCGIGTLSRLQPRGALRDLGRAMNIPYDDVDKMSKLIDKAKDVDTANVEVTWDEILEELGDDLRPWAQKYPTLFKKLGELVGLVRQSSTHAAGILISDESLLGQIPLRLKAGKLVTQFDMFETEEMGFIKFDVLGIRHLDTITHTWKMVHGKETPFDPRYFYDFTPEMYGDTEAWKSVETGHTLGIFQLETAGMRSVGKEFRPHNEVDVAHLISVNRPGVVRVGMLQEYLDRRNGIKQPVYIHPYMEEILGKTYGVVVFQEQVMKIVQRFANYTLIEADKVRKIMGKMLFEKMKEERPVFVERCLQNKDFISLCRGQSPSVVAQEVWRQIEAAGIYSFGEGHALGYGLICAWGTYMKHHHPAEYLTACLITDPEKLALYIKELRRGGYEVLPPDVNESEEKFTLTQKGVRYGLSSVKNVGPTAIKEILQAKPFTSLEDFLHRTRKRVVTSRVIESLIKVGAFETLGPRSMLLREFYQRHGTKDREVPDFTDRDVISQLEMDLIGSYITADPMSPYIAMIEGECIQSPGVIEEAMPGEVINVGGQIARIHEHKCKSGAIMAFLEISWNDDSYSVTVFPDKYSESKRLLKTGKPVVCSTIKDDRGVHMLECIRLDFL